MSSTWQHMTQSSALQEVLQVIQTLGPGVAAPWETYSSDM